MNNVGKKHIVIVEESCSQKPVYFDEALALTGYGKYHHLMVLTAGCCLVCLVCVSMNSAFVIPAAQCDFNMSSQEKGMLTSVLFLGMTISSLFWGYLADTRGRRNIILLTLCCDATVTIVSSFAHTYAFFMLCRFLNGFFISGPAAVTYAYLGEFQTNVRRTRIMIWTSTLLNVGTLGMPALAWLVIPQNWVIVMPWNTMYTSWRIFVVMCSIPSILTACLIACRMKESPKFLLSRGKAEKALHVLRHVYATNTGKDPETYPVKEVLMDPSEERATIRISDSEDKFAIFKTIYYQLVPLVQAPHLTKTILACCIQFGLYASCNGFYLWLPDIFNHQSEFSTRYPDSSGTICEMISNLSFTEQPSDLSRSQYYFEANMNELFFNISNQPVTLLGNSDKTRYNLSNQDSTGAVAVDDCVLHMDSSMFINTLVLGVVCTICYIIVGYVVDHMKKKTILMISLVLAALSGAALYVVETPFLITAMATVFVTLSGIGIIVLLSTIVDVYPTHLRATAVCLALMFGRVGTIFGALLMGVLLEVTCDWIFLILSGILFVCSVLSCFFPALKTKKMYAVSE